MTSPAARTYPRLVCIPSSDTAFADAVQTVAAESPWVDDPPGLAAALRPYFPAVTVRARELAAETPETWYVYRDGHFP